MITHACSILIALLIPGCVWLAGCLWNAYRRGKKLQEQIKNGKVVIEDYEKTFSE